VDLNLRQPLETPERSGQQGLSLRHVPQAEAADRSGFSYFSETFFPPQIRKIDIGRGNN
jgi:hypothetical protein